MNRTTISWCDYSINPIRARRYRATSGSPGSAPFDIVGNGHYCEKIAPGCKNCYASKLQPRFGMPQFQEQRGDEDIEPYLDRSKLHKILRHRKPGRVFWCDMTDMFGHWVPDEWLDECFATMALTPHLTHLVLTKRAKRMHEYFADKDRRDSVEDAGARVAECCYANTQAGWPLPNVWLGVSASTHKCLADQVPWLLKTLAAVRFLSAEPLLEDISEDLCPYLCTSAKLNWIIVGGESGQQARPCHVDWIRNIVTATRGTGTACFVKQLGANAQEITNPWSDLCCSSECDKCGVTRLNLKDRKGGDPSEWPEQFPREFPR